MATSECEPHGNCHTFFEEAATCDGVFPPAPSSRRKGSDRSSDQAQYIDINLAASPQWGRMTVSRRLRKSSDSQEFEFSRPGFAADLVEEACQVAPADELFYKGQLLPLQADPRLHLVQTLSCNDSQPESEMSSRLVLSSLRVQDASKFSSCRMDTVAVLDTSLMDSRCSSFRSQNSSYWESADKDTGDSSSSRDFNGSSQDSYFTGDKGLPRNCQGAKSWNQARRRSVFNWKSFLSGLKIASNAWGEKKKANSSNGIAYSAELVRPKQTTDPLSSTGKLASCNHRVYTDPGANPQQQLKRVSSANLRSRATDEKEDEIKGMRRGRGDSGMERENQRSGAGGGWHSRERWQGYARKLMMLHKLEAGRGFLSMEECGKKACEVKSSTSTTSRSDLRLAPSSSLLKLDDLSRSSRSFLAIASCPASILSSPNHSGLLVPPPCISSSSSTSKAASTSLSTMQELHSAVQGAIAHCKESMIASTPSPSHGGRFVVDHSSVAACSP